MRQKERIRLKGDSFLYMNVSVGSKEILVYSDKMDVTVKEQEIYNELGLKENIYNSMDSIMAARKIKNRFQFQLLDSVTLLLKGSIKNDSVFITAKKQPTAIKNFRLMKNGFHWITE